MPRLPCRWHSLSTSPPWCLGSCPELQFLRLWLGLPMLAHFGRHWCRWLLLLFLLSLIEAVGPSALLSFRKSYLNSRSLSTFRSLW